nr:MAG TPA: hypothetical protein [Caudoviricetes sp.]
MKCPLRRVPHRGSLSPCVAIVHFELQNHPSMTFRIPDSFSLSQ